METRKAGDLPERMHWLLWSLAILPVAWRQIASSDCWWHVALGRWLIERRTLPDYAGFYFTPTNPHVSDLRWSAGGDVVFYLLHAAGGPVALQALSFGCLALRCMSWSRASSFTMNHSFRLATGWKPGVSARRPMKMTRPTLRSHCVSMRSFGVKTRN